MRKNKKYLIILLIVAPVAIWFLTRDDQSTLKERETGFAVKDTSLVTKIFIADKKTNSIVLERTGNGWILDQKYNTNPKVIDGLLSTMHRIKVKSPVPKVGLENVLKRMASIGIKVEIYQQDYRINLFDKFKFFPYEKLSKVYYLGDITSDNVGTYMLMEGADNPYITYIPGFRGFLTPRFSPKPDDWKSHKVFRHTLSEISKVAVEFGETPEESFSVDLSDADGNYKLISLDNNQQLVNYDTLKLLNFLTSFSDLRYETRLNNIMTPTNLDSITSTPVIYKVTLVDDKNDTTVLTAFRKKTLSQKVKDEAYYKLIPDDRDRFYALVNDDEDFVLLQYYVFDKILYPLSHYTE